MNYTLTDLLAKVPNDKFFDSKGDPDFNRIFVEVARSIYAATTEDFAMRSEDFLNETLPNLSSFQRAVAKERKSRE